MIQYFDRFTTYNFFDYGALNVFFNQVYTSVLNAFDADTLQNALIIDGAVAAAIQKVPNVGSIDYITVSICSLPVYNYLAGWISSLPVTDIIYAENRIDVKVLGYIVRFVVTGPLPYLMINEVSIRDKNCM